MKCLGFWMIGYMCVAMTSCVHVGQRLLHVEIEVDGKVAAEGIRGVRDDMSATDFWDELPGVPFELATGAVAADDVDATSQTLEGDIVVRIKHVDREMAKASVKSLSLNKRTDSYWRLSDGESERLKQASGG